MRVFLYGFPDELANKPAIRELNLLSSGTQARLIFEVSGETITSDVLINEYFRVNVYPFAVRWPHNEGPLRWQDIWVAFVRRQKMLAQLEVPILAKLNELVVQANIAGAVLGYHPQTKAIAYWSVLNGAFVATGSTCFGVPLVVADGIEAAEWVML